MSLRNLVAALLAAAVMPSAPAFAQDTLKVAVGLAWTPSSLANAMTILFELEPLVE